jgi:hypothetical protein
MSILSLQSQRSVYKQYLWIIGDGQVSECFKGFTLLTSSATSPLTQVTLVSTNPMMSKSLPVISLHASFEFTWYFGIWKEIREIFWRLLSHRSPADPVVITLLSRAIFHEFTVIICTAYWYLIGRFCNIEIHALKKRFKSVLAYPEQLLDRGKEKREGKTVMQTMFYTCHNTK